MRWIDVTSDLLAFGVWLYPVLVVLCLTLVAGHFGTEAFSGWLNAKIRLPQRPWKNNDGQWMRPPPYLTGLIERTLFFAAVAADLSGHMTGMVGWMALKFTTYWNWNWSGHAPDDLGDQQSRRHEAFAALLTSAVSLLFATLGGLLYRYSAQA